MGVIGREYVEFGQTGLKDLLAGVRDLDKETKRTQKSTALLKKSMSDGSYARAATDYKRAQTALAGLRKEQEAIARNWQRSQLNAKYGRLGGLAAMHGGDALRSAGAMARGLGSSAVGMAAGLGAPLAVGALANRGFSGTAAASALDAQFTRLSRQVATDLLPAMTALTSIVSRISGAREKVRAGTGTAGDYATTAGTYGVLAGGTALGGMILNRMAGGTPGRLLGGAARGVGYGVSALAQAGGAGMNAVSNFSPLLSNALSRAGGPASLAVAGAMRARSSLSESEDAIRNRGMGVLSQDDWDKDRGFLNSIKGMSPETRKKYLEKHRTELYDKDRQLAERAQKRGIFSTTAAQLGFGRGAMDADEQKNINRRLTVVDKLLKGEGPGGGLKMVEGAGERRSSGDLYEELSSAAAKTGLMGNKQGEGNGPLAILTDIRDMFRDFFNKLPI